MINEIKRRLSNDEIIDLGCIDEQSFINKSTRINTEILNQGSLRVDYIDTYNHVHLKGEISCGFNFIYFNELEYFEIKDKDQKPTFDDLISTVVQAYKDGAISRIEWDSRGLLSVYSLHDIMPIVVAGDGVSSDFIEDAIKTIESHYSETFVINDLESLRKVVLGANGVLANGSKFKVLRDSSKFMNKDMLYIEFESERVNHATFEIIKGASVIQNKN